MLVRRVAEESVRYFGDVSIQEQPGDTRTAKEACRAVAEQNTKLKLGLESSRFMCMKAQTKEGLTSSLFVVAEKCIKCEALIHKASDPYLDVSFDPGKNFMCLICSRDFMGDTPLGEALFKVASALKTLCMQRQ